MDARPPRPLRICVLGIRGIENIQGGIETHASELYRRLVKLGVQVDAIVRTPFSPQHVRQVNGIRIHRVWAPRRSGLEAFCHSFLGVFRAARLHPDILHIHAIGPSIVTPIARALGLRVVVTHHGPDYDRDKWGFVARGILKLGEAWGMRYSNSRIAISKVIQSLIRKRHRTDSVLIPNGVNPTAESSLEDRIHAFGLERGRYVLMVSRVVPEKRQLDLISAFEAAAIPGWKLALVGGLGEDDYSRRVRDAATRNVVLTGFQSGESLRQLYSHAAAFVLPSSHEGLPIALLEALSFGLPVIASDIPANREIGLAPECYFKVGDVGELTTQLLSSAARAQTEETRAARRAWVAQHYDWDLIAQQTLATYRAVMANA